MTRPDLSVVILCYRSGELARDVVARMQQTLDGQDFSYEIILVGNYDAHDASDPTPAVVRDIASRDDRIIALTEPKKGMFGWDVRSGLQVARGRVIAFIDGDAQNPVEDIVRLYRALIQGNAEMAQTYRVTRQDGTGRILISKIFNVLTRMLFPRVRILDINSKPKMFTRETLAGLQLKSDDWFIDAEIVLQITSQGKKVVQIPTVFLRNEHRSSFVKAKTLFEFLKNLIRYRFFGA